MTHTRRGIVRDMLAAVVGASLLALPVAGSKTEVNQDLAAVRRATARYHDVSVAEAHGYVSTHHCAQSPAGAMGIHYVNPPLIGNPSLDIERPEILLYVPDGDGLKLVGVEYMKLDADHDVSTDADRPTLFGRGFNGPMLGHEDPSDANAIHYDLHVWVWHANQDGMFALFNPALSC